MAGRGGGKFWWIYYEGLGQKACAAVAKQHLAEIESVLEHGQLTNTGQVVSVQVQDPQTNELRVVQFNEMTLKSVA